MSDLAVSVAYARLGLTKREHQLVELVAEGHSNEEIGGLLFISGETVKSHMRHVLAKLGAVNRTHAVAICFREGALV